MLHDSRVFLIQQAAHEPMHGEIINHSKYMDFLLASKVTSASGSGTTIPHIWHLNYKYRLYQYVKLEQQITQYPQTYAITQYQLLQTLIS